MAFPTTSVLDDFNRADGDPGANWTAPIAFETKFTIVSNAAAAPDFDNAGYWNVGTFGPDSEVFLTRPTFGAGISQLWLRLTSPGTGSEDAYRLDMFPASNFLRIYRVDNDGATQLGATISYTEANGDSVGFEAIGSTLSCYVKTGGVWGAALDLRSDVTYGGAGYIGFSMTSGTGDDFGGGSIASGPAAAAPITFAQGARW